MSEPHPTEVSTHDDGRFVRTAIVVPDSASFDLIDANGKRLALINVFHYEKAEGREVSIDVIDADKNHEGKVEALTYSDGQRVFTGSSGNLVAALFRP